MNKWVRAASLEEVPDDGSGHEVQIEGLEIALFQWDQAFYAIENLCPHLGFPLTEGMVQNGEVVCGWHGWHIRLLDGTCSKKEAKARTYKCEVRKNDLFVNISGD